MSKASAILRRVLLSLTMITSLLACMIKSERTNYILFLCAIGSGALYLVLGVLSILIRSARKRKMDESSEMMDTMINILTVSGNQRTIDFFRRIAFWGTVMMIVNVVMFNITADTLLSEKKDVILIAYHGFLCWSIVALILAFIISLIFFVVYLPHYGEGAYNIFQYIGKLIGLDILAPFRILKHVFFRNESDSGKGNYIFYFIIMLAFIA